MHLNVTFVHGAKVLAKGQRNARLRGFLGRVPVEIAEASDAEAPVALVRREGEGKESRYRFHGGRLWLPSECGEARDAAGLAADAGDGWRGQHRDSPLHCASRETYGPKAERYDASEARHAVAEDPAVAKLVSSDFEARAAEVRAAAADLLLVDGRLHAAAEEPVYIVVQDWFSSQEMGFRNHADSAYWRADELGGAEDARARKGRRREPLPAYPRIDVLIPEAVRAPLPQLALLQEASEILDAISQTHEEMKAMDVATFTAYAALRDALAPARAAIAAEGDRADVGALIPLAEAVADIRVASWHERGMPAYDAPRRDLDAAVSRYREFRGEIADLSATAGRAR